MGPALTLSPAEGPFSSRKPPYTQASTPPHCTPLISEGVGQGPHRMDVSQLTTCLPRTR